MKQAERSLNETEKRSPVYSKQQWRQERLPADELIFTIKTYLEMGLTKEWRYDERRLEEQVSDIVAVLYIAEPILQERRRQAEETERQRREE